MFAKSAPIIGAGATRFRYSTVVQPDRNLIGVKLTGFHFRRQSVAALDQIRNRSVVKVAPAACKGFGRRERADHRSCDDSPHHALSLPNHGHLGAPQQIRCIFMAALLTGLSQTNPETTAQLYPTLRLSERQIWRAPNHS